ncbi:MAG: insulinase family protein [Candidatus Bathyarchaeota archaeon]|nr:insulinase family protein [Candidatus Bathyarchaeota archaeon]
MSANLVWHKNTLPNGLTVLEYPRQSSNTAQISLAVKYGSNQEPKKAAGIAHFLEHMLAGGSEQRIQRSRSIENYGGILDFYTDREHVLATIDVLPEKLSEASRILSELFFGDTFEKDKFELERKIILNELAEVEDDPSVKVDQMLLESLFKNHPIRRPVGGYPRTIKQVELNQIKQAQLVNYVPPNMILTLSGKLPQKALEETIQGFQNQPKGNALPEEKQATETHKPKPCVVGEKAGIRQTYLSIGARTISATHKDAPALDLIATLLSGGTSSRLFIELREKNAVTYDVSSTHCKGADFGYFSVNCAVNNSKVDKARKLILKELAALGNEDICADELERTKQIWLGSLLRGMDSIHDTLEIITYMETQFRSEFALRDYVAKIKALKKEDIRQAASRHLNEDSLCTALLTPK